MTPRSAPPVAAPDPGTSPEVRVQAARVALLYDRNLPAVLAIMPFVCLVWWFLWPVASHPYLHAWVASKSAVTIGLLVLDRLYRRRATVESAGLWGRRYAVALAVDGLTWSLIGLDMVPADRIDLQAVMVAMVVGVGALAVLAQAVHRMASIVFSTTLIAPVAVWYLLQPTRIGVFAGVGLTVFLGFIINNVGRTSRTTREMLRLRYQLDEVAEQRAQALAEAQRHSAVKSQFLATMSHEMRTPLHGILGTVRLMQDEGVPPLLRDRLDLVDRSGQHLLELINDILDFSKTEAGQLRLQPAPFDLHSLLEEVLELSASAARDKGLALQLESPFTDAVWQSGDAQRMRQVMINLVGNAIKFTDRGSVTLVAVRDGDRIRLDVRDTGIGIEADAHSRVFEPFQQVDNSYSRRYGGTGLGLTISRELARAMGGDITCTSAPGQGSTFTLELPWRPCEAPAPVQAAGPVVEAPLQGHVLLAEDNAVNVLVARSMLKGLGLDVAVAADGAEALERYLAMRPAVVLMDCHMPRMDGFEATRRIREEESNRGLPRVPVIAVTANALQDDRDRCLDAGMDDYLAKPFTAAELRALLVRHLPASPDRQAA